MPRINIIAALGKKRELGKKNQLLWPISADLRRFRELTMGHPVIMGRKTYESIRSIKPDAPSITDVLSGRTCIVVSQTLRNEPGCVTTDSLRHALAEAEVHDQKDVFVIGGAQLYEAAMYHAGRLYLTLIEAEDPNADAFFPDYSDFSRVIGREEHVDERSGLPYAWVTFERN